MGIVIKNALTVAVLLIGILSVVALSGATKYMYMKNTDIKWRSYGQDVFKEARRRKKPIYIFIYADWCKWCLKFEVETLETVAIRRRLNNNFVPVAVNYDKQKKLAKQLGTKMVPTSLLLTPDGKKLLRFYGFIGPKDLAETLDQVLVLWRQGKLPSQDFGDVETCCPLNGNNEKGAVQ